MTRLVLVFMLGSVAYADEKLQNPFANQKPRSISREVLAAQKKLFEAASRYTYALEDIATVSKATQANEALSSAESALLDAAQEYSLMVRLTGVPDTFVVPQAKGRR